MVAANIPICAIQNFEPMNFNQLSDKLFQNYEAEAISDEQLLQIIERAAGYLALKTRTNHGKRIGKSYNGVKNYCSVDITIDSVEFSNLLIKL